MKRKLYRSLFSLVIVLCAHALFAQVSSVENSIFWEVSGNGLQESSFLFGSHHLLGDHYVDSLSNVNLKFHQSAAFASEVLTDSADLPKLLRAALMKDTTLEQLLTREWFIRTEEWLKELSEYTSLAPFNNLNPVTIELMIVNLLQIQIYGDVAYPMDTYLESKARLMEKKMYGLETMDQQLIALFHSTTYRRQAERLIEFVQKKELARDELIRFNRLYRSQSLSVLLETALAERYTDTEFATILIDRNAKWMGNLPRIFGQQSTFVVVGALHLAGEYGLVSRLRQLGYTVTPISIY